MQVWELIFLGFALAMDAFAVSVCKGLSVKKLSFKYFLSVALWFGLFQGLMPIIGYGIGSTFDEIITSMDHWVAFALLSIIGAGMIKGSFKDSDKCQYNPDFGIKVMFTLAIATSIDALAVGFTFAFLSVNIYLAAIIITLITGIMAVIGLKIGSLFGCRYKSKAELAGGIILILIGLKILIEHLISGV